ncbi:nuclear transport factor 2 family protein [Gordonia sp. LSe1-13]|uniref:Nuclear transport factor 2 family protein n=1 Tax=Gordonia sesuvii TaxID=3116777 RepID=A0ABU7MDN3_9ACTN|nr:nuclear transport factor 2 family protein [Gordonia sp. LSe1-13]
MTTTDMLIRSLEDRRYDAITSGDFDSFAALAHPSLVYTHSNGATDTLESYMDKCSKGFYVYHQVDHPIDFIRIVGDVALVVGEMNAAITAGGVEKVLRNRCLAVWKVLDGEWKLLAYQPTPI